MIFTTEGGDRIETDDSLHIVVPLTVDMIEKATRIGIARHEAKHTSARDYQRIDISKPYDEDIRGAVGEVAFEALTGLSMDESISAKGDNGRDFCYRDRVVGVSIAQHPGNLFLKSHVNTEADIMLLGAISQDRSSVVFFGWATVGELKTVEPRRFHKTLNIWNHYIPRSSLRPMRILLDDIKRGVCEE